MKKETQIFTGLNLDDDPELINSGEYLGARNVEEDPLDEGGYGRKRKAKGNRAVDTSEIYSSKGYYTPMFTCPDIERNAVIHFVHHEFDEEDEDGGHLIFWQFADGTCQVIMRDWTLNFSKEHPVRDADVIDDKLYFNDRYNPPRKLNLTKASNHAAGLEENAYIEITDRLLKLHKAPPVNQCWYGWEANPDIEENLLSGVIWKFSYRYVYDDNEKSVIAPYSKVVISPYDGINIDGKHGFTRWNQINVHVNTGPYYVKKVEILATNDKLQRIFLVGEIEKYDSSGNALVASDFEYQYEFRNDGFNKSVSLDEVATTYSRVPLLAGAQVVVDENTLVFGDIEENYEEFDGVAHSLSVTPTHLEYDDLLVETIVETAGYSYIIARLGPGAAQYTYSGQQDFLHQRISFSDIEIGVEKEWILELMVDSDEVTDTVSFTQEVADSIDDVRDKFIAAVNGEATGGMGTFLAALDSYYATDDEVAYKTASFVSETAGTLTNLSVSIIVSVNPSTTDDDHQYYGNGGVALYFTKDSGAISGSGSVTGDNGGYGGKINHPINITDDYIYILNSHRAYERARPDVSQNDVFVETKFIKVKRYRVVDTSYQAKKASLKEGATYAVSIIYYDEDLVTPGRTMLGRINIPRNQQFGLGTDDNVIWSLNYSIIGQPPTWGKWWQIAISERLNFYYYKEFMAEIGEAGVCELTGNTLTIDIELLVLNRFGTNVSGYEFVPGDAIVFCRYFDGTDIIAFDSKVAHIINQHDTTSGLYYIELSDELVTELSGMTNVLLEVVRPSNEPKDIVWYEVGELNPIQDTDGSLRWHVHTFVDETTTDQSVSTFAQKQLYIGDIWRRVSLFRGGGGSILIEDNEASDFFKSSLNDYGRPIPYAPVNKTDRKSLLRASEKYFDNTEVNGLSMFLADNYKPLEEQHGRIIGLEYVGYTLVVIQERMVTSIYVRRYEAQTGDGGGQLQVVKQVFGTTRPSTVEIGSQHYKSIIRSERDIYFLDSLRGRFYKRSANGTYCISGRDVIEGQEFDGKVQSFFSSWSYRMQTEEIDCLSGYDPMSKKIFVSFVKRINPVEGTVTHISLPSGVGTVRFRIAVVMTADEFAIWNVLSSNIYIQSWSAEGEFTLALVTIAATATVSGNNRTLDLFMTGEVDPFEVDDVVMIHKQPTDYETISYSEKNNYWSSNHDFAPIHYGVFNQAMITSGPKTAGEDGIHGFVPFIHDDSENRAVYYGIENDFEIDAVFNFVKEHGPSKEKTFSAMWVDSSEAPLVDPISVFNGDEQVALSRLLASKFRKQSGVYYAGFLRNILNVPDGVNLINGKTLCGKSLRMKIKHSGPDKFHVLYVNVLALSNEVS